MTMITPSYLGETIEYSSLHACRSTLEDPTVGGSSLVCAGDFAGIIVPRCNPMQCLVNPLVHPDRICSNPRPAQVLKVVLKIAITVVTGV